MSFADEMAQVATELLTEFDEREPGGKIKLIRQGIGVWDEIEGETVFPDPVEIDLTGVAVPYSATLVNGTTIQAGDIKLTITNGVEPTQADKVLIDGVQYSIVANTPFAYTGKDLTIAYAVQLRK
jgi:hypothetical protein